MSNGIKVVKRSGEIFYREISYGILAGLVRFYQYNPFPSITKVQPQTTSMFMSFDKSLTFRKISND